MRALTCALNAGPILMAWLGAFLKENPSGLAEKEPK